MSAPAGCLPVFVSLGSNIGESEIIFNKATAAIARLPHCEITASSKIYHTEPQGFKDQPWFKNQILKIALGREWQPQNFLTALLKIETSLGRERNGPRFGPRKIDIDLLLFGNLCSSQPDCILPHPRMLERAFILVPMLELQPYLQINGLNLQDALHRLKWRLVDNKIFQN